MRPHVLVTGATGFLGAALVLELLEPASEGWARVRYVEGFEGYVHASEVWGL